MLLAIIFVLGVFTSTSSIHRTTPLPLAISLIIPSVVATCATSFPVATLLAIIFVLGVFTSTSSIPLAVPFLALPASSSGTFRLLCRFNFTLGKCFLPHPHLVQQKLLVI